MKIEDVMPLIEAVKPRQPAVHEKKESAEVPQPQEAMQQVKQASVYMQQLSQSFNKKLAFSVDDRIDRILVKVVNKDTNEIIREIPSQEFVDMVARMRQYIGTMFDDIA